MQEAQDDDGVGIIQLEDSDPPQFLSEHDVWGTIGPAARFPTQRAAQVVIDAGRCPDGSKGVAAHHFEFKVGGS